MKFILLSAVLVTLGLSTASTATPHALKGTHLWRREGEHKFTLINKCPQAVTPKIIDTKCGFSPRECAVGSSDALISTDELARALQAVQTQQLSAASSLVRWRLEQP